MKLNFKTLDKIYTFYSSSLSLNISLKPLNHVRLGISSPAQGRKILRIESPFKKNYMHPIARKSHSVANVNIKIRRIADAKKNNLTNRGYTIITYSLAKSNIRELQTQSKYNNLMKSILLASYITQQNAGP